MSSISEILSLLGNIATQSQQFLQSLTVLKTGVQIYLHRFYRSEIHTDPTTEATVLKYCAQTLSLWFNHPLTNNYAIGPQEYVSLAF